MLASSRLAFLALAGMGFAALPAWSRAQEPRPVSAVVRQVDHLLIRSSNAKELFALFAETFEFPVAWPFSDYGGFASGGVALGNVNVEILKSPETTGGAASARVVGLALEPEPLQFSLPELDARCIPRGAPAAFQSRRLIEAFKTLWTTVTLPELSGDHIQIFLCEYGHDQPARRERLREQLQSRGGGPLSLHSVREIVLGVRDLKPTEEQWQKLLYPQPASSPGRWPLGSGPALRLSKAERDEIQELVINVISLDQARDFLKEHHWLGSDQLRALIVSHPWLQGVTLTLRELPRADLPHNPSAR